MKVLDFEAVRAIAAQTPDSELIRWVDEALREKSGYTLPPKIHIAQQDGDYYNVMPCIYERGNIAMVKMIGRHSIKRGEDRSSMMGDILLYESDTGILRALMDGEYSPPSAPASPLPTPPACSPGRTLKRWASSAWGTS